MNFTFGKLQLLNINQLKQSEFNVFSHNLHTSIRHDNRSFYKFFINCSLIYLTKQSFKKMVSHKFHTYLY